jgi:cytochrome c oxidase subunit 4
MTEAHPHGPNTKTYMVVAGALAIFTASSFIFNQLAQKDVISTQQSFTLILAVAVCKTTLVGMYFMHLKFEWGKLYFMIIPAFILGAMMMAVLLPDTVIGWHLDAKEASAPAAKSAKAR